MSMIMRNADLRKTWLLEQYNGEFLSFDGGGPDDIYVAFEKNNLWHLQDGRCPIQVREMSRVVTDRRIAPYCETPLGCFDDEGDPVPGTGTKGYLAYGYNSKAEARAVQKLALSVNISPEVTKIIKELKLDTPELEFGRMPSDGDAVTPPAITPAPAFMMAKHAKPMLGLDIIHNPDKKLF